MSGRRLVVLLVAAMALTTLAGAGLMWVRRGQPVKEALALPNRCDRVRALLALERMPEARIELAHQLALPTNLTLGDADVARLRESLGTLGPRCPAEADGRALRELLLGPDQGGPAPPP